MKFRDLNQGPSLINNTTIIGSKPLRPKIEIPSIHVKESMTFKKLFMRAILPVLMLGAVFGINLLIMPILPGNYIGLALKVVLSCIMLVAALEIYHKLYRSWLSTKQDEIKERLRQRAKAKGKEAEENLDIILKCMEANGILVDY